MKKVLLENRKLIVITYLILSFIKFFTARIDHVREEDPTIYFKFSPTLWNTFYGGEDNSGYREVYSKLYSWYNNYQYWEILHFNSNYKLYFLYQAVIFLWWISSALLICYAIYKLLNNSGNVEQLEHKGSYHRHLFKRNGKL